MRTPPSGLRPGFFTADMIVRARFESGIGAIDGLLGGGLEAGMMHLFYGDRCLHDDVLRIAVKAQMPKDKGGLDSPVILIDSANIVKIHRLADLALGFDEEPESVLDRIYISRAFNSSQTYDLVMNHLDSFFSSIPARMLLATGLPQLYMEEGLESKGYQELSHMASKLMRFTLQRNLFAIVTAPAAEKRIYMPAGGKTLASAAQVHIRAEEHQSYVAYTLAKHPQYPVRSSKRSKDVTPDGIIPLSHFLRGTKEDLSD